MALVKRDSSGKFLESYEIFHFSADLDKKSIVVSLTHYTGTPSGVPTAVDINHVIFDRQDIIATVKPVERMVLSRDKSGAIIMDKNGNAVLVPQVTDEAVGEKVQINAFTEIVSAMTSGKSLYKEIQSALYASFKKYQLKDDTFVIE